LLTEQEVARSWSQIFKKDNIELASFDRAEQLLDELRPESPLRHRLTRRPYAPKPVVCPEQFPRLWRTAVRLASGQAARQFLVDEFHAEIEAVHQKILRAGVVVSERAGKA
jgi:hypothetical protein